jgi:alpha-L-fucosidase
MEKEEYMTMAFEATRESLETHEVPDWYHDAKLGIFIHWGLFSVPGWAYNSGKDIVSLIATEGVEAIKKTPYAEWYMNTMQFKDYPTWQYHVKTYGADYAYYDFQEPFETASTTMQPDEWADLFSLSGARYVIMVTKHHDGYLLWPSRHQNPVMPNLQSRRDLVGEVTQAVRARDMRVGYYYSGVFDWSIFHPPIGDAFTWLLNHQQDESFARYAESHFRELIDRYQPSVLWNDIGCPPDFRTEELIAHYYNTITEGIVNDRWSKRNLPKDPAEREKVRESLLKLDTRIRLESRIPDCHWDFLTPEYTSYEEATEYKWEATRGIGRSFGYNREETEADMIHPDELIRTFVDIVSKNGNLLLNVGPMADGTIPDMQVTPLKALGAWLETNGEAVYDTRPWERAQGKTTDDLDLRFTAKGDSVYATVLGEIKTGEVRLFDLIAAENTEVQLLGQDGSLSWEQQAADLRIELPRPPKDVIANSFKITPGPTNVSNSSS